MHDGLLETGRSAGYKLRHILREADDQKILRITAILDAVTDTTLNQSVLDPLRARLGQLRPSRLLRFPRLLFTPLDPLIVPTAKWKPSQAAIPRTALMSLSRVVRAGLGADAAVVDKTIFDHTMESLQLINTVGRTLWPRAADILAASTAPADWSETGLTPAHYPSLALSIAAVLRRAPYLRSLSLNRDMIGAKDVTGSKVGGGDKDVARPTIISQAIHDILLDIGSEPPAARVMVVRLIVLQSPHAAELLRRFRPSGQDKADGTALQRAIAQAKEQILADLESEPDHTNGIARAPLADVRNQVRHMDTLLRELEGETAAPEHRRRLTAIRAKLNKSCQARFAAGLNVGVILPLTGAGGPVTSDAQTQMEICARTLRALDAEGRKFGASGPYDQLLAQASQTVKAAAAGGRLTPIRTSRLIEILSGSEAATALYKGNA
jgi:hypothetical protein